MENLPSLTTTGAKTLVSNRTRTLLTKTALFVFSIAVFMFALILMKEGARPLAPIIRDRFSVDSPASAIGFGWFSASLALSGSPIAATALTFLDAKVLSPIESFSMIAGSRLGASFIVLLVGFIYMMRGRKRDVSVGVGLLSLLVTQTLYVPVLILGYFILSRGWLQKWQIQATEAVNSPFDIFFDPMVAAVKTFMPVWVLFPIGFLLMVWSMWLFDKVLPNLHLEETEVGFVHHLLYRPIVTFALGAGITALTMSVSVSLSLLVPLSVRGYVRRENAIPYILGANITTFIDTLIAAALLGNPAAITVVLVQMISVTIVSLLILLTSYRLYARGLEKLVRKISSRRRYLVGYIFLALGVPLALLLIG